MPAGPGLGDAGRLGVRVDRVGHVVFAGLNLQRPDHPGVAVAEDLRDGLQVLPVPVRTAGVGVVGDFQAILGDPVLRSLPEFFVSLGLGLVEPQKPQGDVPGPGDMEFIVPEFVRVEPAEVLGLFVRVLAGVRFLVRGLAAVAMDGQVTGGSSTQVLQVARQSGFFLQFPDLAIGRVFPGVQVASGEGPEMGIGPLQEQQLAVLEDGDTGYPVGFPVPLALSEAHGT